MRRLFALLVLVLLPMTEAAARTGQADLCRAAATRAARAHDVPPEMMQAITLVETGRSRDGTREPWPWTVNVTGRGYWFDSREKALAHVRETLKQGETSFDVGCFQLNYHWHGQAFRDVEQMFDPEDGADYAARFLRGLYDEAGDWMTAAGYYHSRTKAHFDRYTGLIAAALDREVPQALALASAAQATGWPLARLGVPATAPAAAAAPGGVSLAVFGPRRSLLGRD